jgi:membrane-associated protein
LIGPLGPWINVTSGLTEYPWRWFILLDVAGELLWLLIYVSLGRQFSDQVQTVASLLGNLTWVVLGLLVTGLLGWKLFGRRKAEVTSDATV